MEPPLEEPMIGVMSPNELKLMMPRWLSDEQTVAFRQRQIKALIYAYITYQSPHGKGADSYVTEICQIAAYVGGLPGREVIEFAPAPHQNEMK